MLDKQIDMKKKTMLELERVDCEEYHSLDKIPLVVILEDIRSLNNIGSIFRTSDAFRVEKIFLCGITATPPNPDIHKTALGAEDSVEWEYSADSLSVINKLKEDGYTVCAIEQVNGSVDFTEYEISKSGKYAVILGNEVKGVSQVAVDEADVCLELPQYGTKHSLNVSITGGIVIWNFFLTLRHAVKL